VVGQLQAIYSNRHRLEGHRGTNRTDREGNGLKGLGGGRKGTKFPIQRENKSQKDTNESSGGGGKRKIIWTLVPAMHGGRTPNSKKENLDPTVTGTVWTNKTDGGGNSCKKKGNP